MIERCDCLVVCLVLFLYFLRFRKFFPQFHLESFFHSIREKLAAFEEKKASSLIFKFTNSKFV